MLGGCLCSHHRSVVSVISSWERVIWAWERFPPEVAESGFDTPRAISRILSIFPSLHLTPQAQAIFQRVSPGNHVVVGDCLQVSLTAALLQVAPGQARRPEKSSENRINSSKYGVK